MRKEREYGTYHGKTLEERKKYSFAQELKSLPMLPPTAT